MTCNVYMKDYHRPPGNNQGVVCCINWHYVISARAHFAVSICQDMKQTLEPDRKNLSQTSDQRRANVDDVGTALIWHLSSAQLISLFFDAWRGCANVKGTLHTVCPHPSKHNLYNICTTPAQRLRRWSNIGQMLYIFLCFPGWQHEQGALRLAAQTCERGPCQWLSGYLSQVPVSRRRFQTDKKREINVCPVTAPSLQSERAWTKLLMK